MNILNERQQAGLDYAIAKRNEGLPKNAAPFTEETYLQSLCDDLASQMEKENEIVLVDNYRKATSAKKKAALAALK